jgi:hypothetical protein
MGFEWDYRRLRFRLDRRWLARQQEQALALDYSSTATSSFWLSQIL